MTHLFTLLRTNIIKIVINLIRQINIRTVIISNTYYFKMM